MNAKVKAAGYFTLGVLAVMVVTNLVAGTTLPLLSTVAKKATGRA